MPARRKASTKALAALAAAAMTIAAQPGGAEPEAAAAAPAPAMQSRQVSLSEAQALAGVAINRGRPHLAYKLSEGLLQANPEDGLAHYLQARALAQLQSFEKGRHSAKLAYRHAQTDLQRFEAAKLAAELSFADERLTASQFWLRRAAHYAPDEATRDKTVNAFRTVRYRNPVNLQLSFSINPSDNVNNGANSPYNVIEGSPLVGRLSPSAQAISGVVATADIRGSYRLSQSERHETRLLSRIRARVVRFNDPVTGLSGDDLSEFRAGLGLNHRWATSARGYWSVEAHAGRQWYGGNPLYNYLGGEIARVQKLGENLHLSFGAGIEEQFDQSPPIADATVYSVFTGLSYRLAGGGKLGASVHYRETQSAGANRSSEQWTGIATYTMGRQIGPAELTLSVGHSTLDYDRYAVIFPVPGGRVDSSWFGGVTASFNDYSYMGFVPTMTLHAEKSRSNISRFDVDQTSVSFGIRSEF